MTEKGRAAVLSRQHRVGIGAYRREGGDIGGRSDISLNSGGLTVYGEE
jgi:hypothetical protein